MPTARSKRKRRENDSDGSSLGSDGSDGMEIGDSELSSLENSDDDELDSVPKKAGKTAAKKKPSAKKAGGKKKGKGGDDADDGADDAPGEEYKEDASASIDTAKLKKKNMISPSLKKPMGPLPAGGMKEGANIMKVFNDEKKHFLEFMEVATELYVKKAPPEQDEGNQGEEGDAVPAGKKKKKPAPKKAKKKSGDEKEEVEPSWSKLGGYRGEWYKKPIRMACCEAMRAFVPTNICSNIGIIALEACSHCASLLTSDSSALLRNSDLRRDYECLRLFLASAGFYEKEDVRKTLCPHTVCPGDKDDCYRLVRILLANHGYDQSTLESVCDTYGNNLADEALGCFNSQGHLMLDLVFSPFTEPVTLDGSDGMRVSYREDLESFAKFFGLSNAETGGQYSYDPEECKKSLAALQPGAGETSKKLESKLRNPVAQLAALCTKDQQGEDQELSLTAMLIDGLGSDQVALKPKRHQLDSIAWMLRRELYGYQRFVELTVPESITGLRKDQMVPAGKDSKAILNPITGQFFVPGGARHEEIVFHQQDCVEKYNPVVRGGILADDMGLGKSFDILTLLKLNALSPLQVGEKVFPPSLQYMREFVELNKDPAFLKKMPGSSKLFGEVGKLHQLKATLIVAPVSTCGQWCVEIEKILPDSKYIVYHGTNRHRYSVQDLEEADIILTTYETIKQDILPTSKTHFSRLARTNGSSVLHCIDHVGLARHFVKNTNHIKNMKKLLKRVVEKEYAYGSVINGEVKKMRDWVRKMTGVKGDAVPYAPSSYRGFIHTFEMYLSSAEVKSEHHGLHNFMFQRLVLDEAHKVLSVDVKNWREWARMFRVDIQATHKWALTGTPFGNKSSELSGYLELFGLNSVAYGAPGYWPEDENDDDGFDDHFSDVDQDSNEDWDPHAEAPSSGGVSSALAKCFSRRLDFWKKLEEEFTQYGGWKKPRKPGIGSTWWNQQQSSKNEPLKKYASLDFQKAVYKLILDNKSNPTKLCDVNLILNMADTTKEDPEKFRKVAKRFITWWFHIIGRFFGSTRANSFPRHRGVYMATGATFKKYIDMTGDALNDLFTAEEVKAMDSYTNCKGKRPLRNAESDYSAVDKLTNQYWSGDPVQKFIRELDEEDAEKVEEEKKKKEENSGSDDDDDFDYEGSDMTYDSDTGDYVKAPPQSAFLKKQKHFFSNLPNWTERRKKDQILPSCFGFEFTDHFHLLSNLVIRHSKNSPIVISDLKLPPKTVLVHSYKLSDEERSLYDDVEKKVKDQIQSLILRNRLGNRVGKVLQWVNLLRRLLIHPSLCTSSVTTLSDESASAKEVAKIEVKDPKDVVKELKKANEANPGSVPASSLQVLEDLCQDPPDLPDCIICCDSVQLPVLLSCNHIFCRECVFAVAGSAAPICPICRAPSIKGNKIQLKIPQVEEEAVADLKDFAKRAAAVGLGTKLHELKTLMEGIWSKEGKNTKIVIFSSDVGVMGKVSEDVMKPLGVTHAIIDGSTTLKKRTATIENFQNPHSKMTVCLVTARCGNAGITLTAAHHLILLEPSLNTVMEQQAMARVHRFGQTSPVTIHRLVAQNTLEERTLTVTTKKLGKAFGGVAATSTTTTGGGNPTTTTAGTMQDDPSSPLSTLMAAGTPLLGGGMERQASFTATSAGGIEQILTILGTSAPSSGF